MENQNNVTEFVFLGLLENKQIELLLCFLFLLCYLSTLMGNFLMPLTITCTHLIEQPMYHFLCHLSFKGLSFTCVVVPWLIRDLASERKIISYNNCITQLFTFHLLAGVEIFISVSMAFDCYVAIVKPLHYMVIMNRQRCNTLIFLAWVLVLWHAIALLLMVLNLPFCGLIQTNHYMCEVKPLLKLVCKDFHVVSILVIVNLGMSGALIFPGLVTSYKLILYNLKTHTSAAQHKALSTCSSHIMVVVLFFGPGLYIYAMPAVYKNKDKGISVFYTVIVPMLSPFICTLRNMEMKISLQKVWSQMAIEN